ncbi:hypothetical protein PIPA1_32020 [Pelosinus sp. IPA-1]|nr:hypothetical protein PIPA1_32020 [Pelosinus sp. IPA-1]
MDNRMEYLLQVAHECILNSEYAIDTYIEEENISNKLYVSLQFMNQAFQCAKQFQNQYYLIRESKGPNYLVEQFYHQFLFVNQEYLDSLKTDHSLQETHSEFKKLEDFYNELRSSIE